MLFESWTDRVLHLRTIFRVSLTIALLNSIMRHKCLFWLELLILALIVSCLMVILLLHIIVNGLVLLLNCRLLVIAGQLTFSLDRFLLTSCPICFACNVLCGSSTCAWDRWWGYFLHWYLDRLICAFRLFGIYLQMVYILLCTIVGWVWILS